MENFTPISALFGGALIGLGITLLLLFNGRMAGISGIMNGLFNSPKEESRWRFTFLSGLILGAVLFIILPMLVGVMGFWQMVLIIVLSTVRISSVPSSFK